MTLNAQAKANRLRAKANAEIEQLERTLDIIGKGGDTGTNTYIIENFDRFIQPFAETLGFFNVDKLSVITGAEGSHEPISAIHPNAVAKEKNDFIAAALSAAFGEQAGGRGGEDTNAAGGRGRRTDKADEGQEPKKDDS